MTTRLPCVSDSVLTGQRNNEQDREVNLATSVVGDTFAERERVAYVDKGIEAD